MEKNRKLTFIATTQFGYLTDLYKWCQYLRVKYDITVVSAIRDRAAVAMDGIQVIGVDFNVAKPLRALKFYFRCLRYLWGYEGRVFIVYFQGCSLLKLLCPWKKMHVDVRTLWVSPDAGSRRRYDRQLVRDCRRFDSVSAISRGVAEKMGLKGIKIVPLGSDVISVAPKQYADGIRLLYVGTLQWRHIEHTIKGVRLFVDRHPEVPIHYDLVGSGNPGDVELMQTTAAEEGLEDTVTVHGWKLVGEVQHLFDRCNVGICYVPTVSYYQHQPPTKIYEYVLSGMYCIATATLASRELIGDANGTLIEATPEGVAQGLETFWRRRTTVVESRLRQTLADSTWDRIVSKYVEPIIEAL